MAACMVLLALVALMVIRQDGQDASEIRRIEEQQRNAPRRQRRAYVDYYAR